MSVTISPDCPLCLGGIQATVRLLSEEVVYRCTKCNTELFPMWNALTEDFSWGTTKQDRYHLTYY